MTPTINGVVLALSSSPAASIVAKATVITTLGLIGAWLARGSRAAVRHAVLAASFAVLLALPIASTFITPVRVALTASTQEWAPLSAFPAPVDATQPAGSAHGSAVAAPGAPRWREVSPTAILLAVWIAGMAFFLLRMIFGLQQVRALRRFGVPWRGGQSVVDRLALDAGVHRRVEVLLHESLPAPVTCGIVRPAIVLPPDTQEWEGEDLNRAIVHELEHVRRCDWMTHCLARIVCAVYWFHPLVWIGWRQLALEAERSCDDAVLGRSEATAYADQLVGLARRLSVAQPPVLAMANRSDLSARVGSVLDGSRARGRAGALLVTVACAAAAAVVLTMSPLRMVAAPQSSPARTSGPLPAFDVASIKIALPSEPGLVETHFASDSLTLNRVILSIPVMVAYGLQSFQISGPDNLLRETRYDIVAKASGPVPESQLRLMLRTLLAERFHFAFHWEKKEMSVLALVVARDGVKFHATAPTDANASGRTLNGFSDVGYQYSQGQDGRAHRVLTNASMAAVAQLLGGNCVGGDGHTPVVDMTGTLERFDLEFTDPPRSAFDDPPTGDYKLAACKAMMQDDLGLTFERRKAPVDVLVVDHADKTPIPN